MRNTANNTIYTAPDPLKFLYSFKGTLIISPSSIFSLHFSTNLSINHFLHL